MGSSQQGRGVQMKSTVRDIIPFTQGPSASTMPESPGGVQGMIVQCSLIEVEEFMDRQRVGSMHGDDTAYVEVGMMWYLPWIWDHQCPDAEQYLPRLVKDAENRKGRNSLSLAYLRDHATTRDPLAVMLPEGQIFYPDCSPGQGKFWTVKGPAPLITVNQYIVVGPQSEYRYKLTEGRLTLEGYSV